MIQVGVLLAFNQHCTAELGSCGLWRAKLLWSTDLKDTHEGIADPQKTSFQYCHSSELSNFCVVYVLCGNVKEVDGK